MSVKTSTQIRQEFLDFFAKKDHAVVESAPVVPKNDPTLLFTNAGMNQFKSIFLGDEKTLKYKGKEWKRAVDTQKCIRVSGKHNDLEEVGHDTYHHTLFEMLGNWSFGDYFKKEAIAYAWELLVEVWGLEPDRIYVTVFEGDEEDGLPVDDEAIEFWKSETPIKHSHILKFDKTDNFWEMGDTGPCGPCSEVHVDLRTDEEREKVDGITLVNKDDPRVMEIWNLVFIQFNRHADGTLVPLPAQHVDTGMGFERICAVLQGKSSNYDTDVFTPLLDKIGDLANVEYGKDEKTDIAMRVIADHIRAVAFSIADGASPGNDGRGYVIRRILRRAIRYGWDALGLKEPFFYKLVDVLAQQFEGVFPEIEAQKEFVKKIILSEEKSFLKTLGQGIALFNKVAKGKKIISGDDAFKLHDTYGFPIDLTQLMAREMGLKVDENRFEELMKEQKDRARAAGKFTLQHDTLEDWIKVSEPENTSANVFVGYDTPQINTHITSYRHEGKKIAIQLDQTPFYAESGGQIADIGTLTKGEEVIKIVDVQKVNEVFVHYAETVPDNLSGVWQAKIDVERRNEVKKHHTATHILHAVLREELGDHVVQKGSLVANTHLRFDFSHFEAVSQSKLEQIERKINERIQENIPLIEEREVAIKEAKNRGAMMLFGEKYGDFVRIVTFGKDFSVELCGGTHVNATGEIGYFRFTQEASVAAGVRRLEAVCGKAADKNLRDERNLLLSIKEVVGQSDDIPADIQKLIDENKSLEKELSKINLQNTGAKLKELLANPETIKDGIQLVKGEINGADMNMLKQLGYDALQQNEKNTVIVLASANNEDGKVFVMAAVTDDLIKQKELKAGALVGRIGRLVGGGGGGQPNLATAGGKNPEKLPETLKKVNEIIEEFIH